MLKWARRHISILMGREKTLERPFGQSVYDTGLLKPTLEGLHYKFTMLLPVTEFPAGKERESKIVFTYEDLGEIRNLLRKDFGGVTYSLEGKHPLLQGDWIGKKGDVVVNEHMLLEVYAQKNNTAVEYFTELKARLLKHVKDVRNVEQEEIVIEQAIVDFIPKKDLPTLRKEPIEKPKDSDKKLKYSKR